MIAWLYFALLNASKEMFHVEYDYNSHSHTACVGVWNNINIAVLYTFTSVGMYTGL